MEKEAETHHSLAVVVHIGGQSVVPGQRGGGGKGGHGGAVVHASSGAEAVAVAGQHHVSKLLLLLGVAENSRLHVHAARAVRGREGGRAQLQGSRAHLCQRG